MGEIKDPQIISGLPQSLYDTTIGTQGKTEKNFLERYLLLGTDLLERAPLHIAIHLIKDLDEPPPPYAQIHCHPDCDEIGLVAATKDELEYEIILNGKEHRVKSPATVYIPAGTYHRARAVYGKGVYVCILLDPRGPAASNVHLSEQTS